MKVPAILLFTLTLLCNTVLADTTNLIIELVPFAVADGARESNYLYGHVSEGTTSFCQLSIGYGVQITRVDGLGGPLTETQLVAPSNWLAASGQSGCTAFYGFDVWGDDLQFGDTFSDQIWRVNKHTGALRLHIGKDAITNALGSSNVNWPPGCYMTDHRDGAIIFSEGQSRSIIRARDSSNIAFYVTATQLSNAFGFASIVGGMTMDAAGNLYFCAGTVGTNRAVMVYTTNGTLAVAVPNGVITNMLNIGGINPQEIFYAPDGWIYLAVGLSQNRNNILRFWPTNPVASLQYVLNTNQLYESISGNEIASMDWHHGLTWHLHTMRKGVYSYLTDLAASLAIAGAAEIAEYSTNVPYTCAVRLTNGWGAALAYDRTSTAAWSLVSDVPLGVTLENNLLTVGPLLSNAWVTLQAASEFGSLAATGTYVVALVPEPAVVMLLLALPLLVRRA